VACYKVCYAMLIIADDGFRKLYVQYLKLRGKVWQYVRPIPKDLYRHFPLIHTARKLKRVSLKTENKREAILKASKLAAADTAYFKLLRAGPTDASQKELRVAARVKLEEIGYEIGATSDYPYCPLDDYLESKHSDKQARDWGNGNREAALSDYFDEFDKALVAEALGKPEPKLLSDALDHYLSNHDRGHEKRFSGDHHRALGYVYQVVGNRELTAYKRADAEAVRDYMLSRTNSRTGEPVTTTTVDREFERIRAAFKDGLTAFDLSDKANPFAGVKIKGLGKDATKRESFTDAERAAIAAVVRANPDDELWQIVGLLADTGARLKEVCGLKRSDLVGVGSDANLDNPIPFMRLQEYPERGLKTGFSKRNVPLLGLALFSAENALRSPNRPAPWLFRYCATGGSVRNDAASGAIGKRLKTRLKLTKTLYGLRHAMKDRVRAAGVPEDIQEALLGHGEFKIPDGYGSGYDLEMKLKWLGKVIERDGG